MMMIFRKMASPVVLLAIVFNSSAARANDPIDCMRAFAKIQNGTTVGLATRLCAASWSPEPLKCYIRVSEVDKTISVGISIDLCAGSTDAERTISCYLRASKDGLNRGLSTTLCGAKKQVN